MHEAGWKELTSFHFMSFYSATADCTDGSIRLVNGSSPLNGRLEVCAFRIWGTVCDDQFDSREATVACRQLGLGKHNAHACINLAKV